MEAGALVAMAAEQHPGVELGVPVVLHQASGPPEPAARIRIVADTHPVRKAKLHGGNTARAGSGRRRPAM